MSRGSPRPSSSERKKVSQSAPACLPGLLDVVRVRRSVPEHGIKAGDEGTAVEILARPPGHLVDFSYEPGFDTHELPVYGLTADQIEVVRRGRQSG